MFVLISVNVNRNNVHVRCQIRIINGMEMFGYQQSISTNIFSCNILIVHL